MGIVSPLCGSATGPAADPCPVGDHLGEEYVPGRLTEAALHRADEQLLPEGLDREALRHFAARRRAFRCRRHMGKLVQSPDQHMGAHLCRHHRSGERAYHTDPRSHARRIAERAVPTPAK
jgi:hypothetical protein